MIATFPIATQFPIELSHLDNIDSLRVQTRRQSLDDCQTRYYKYERAELPSPVLGTPVDLEELAHVAAIGWTHWSNTTDWRCGGSLISDRWILSAAHCSVFKGRNPNVARLGDRNPFRSDVDEESAQEFEIVLAVRHPDYRSSATYFDIALFEIGGTIRPSKFVLPACLWTDEEETSFEDFQYEAVGFGQTGFFEDLAESFQKVALNYVRFEECQKYHVQGRRFPKGLVDHQMCAQGSPQGDVRPDTCSGDSGGPLQVKLLAHGRMTAFVVGITSFGKGCGADDPGVYVKVAAFRDFIENVTQISFEPRSSGCVLRYISLRELDPGTPIHTDRSDLLEDEDDEPDFDWLDSKVHMARDHRYKAYLGRESSNGTFDWFCGATLISEKWLLTTAQCLQKRPSIAQIGGLRMPSPKLDPKAIRISVQQTISHPGFRAGEPHDNIGLVELEEYVRPSNDIVPACLWKKKELPTDTFGVYGWGPKISNYFFMDLDDWEEGNDEIFPLQGVSECDEECQVGKTKSLESLVGNLETDELRYLEVNSSVLEFEVCSEFFKKKNISIRESTICLKNQPFSVPGTCQLDEGGAVERKIWTLTEYQSYVFGVNSFGKNCGFGTPAVATRVSSYADWIESQVLNQTKSASADRNVDSEIFFLDNHDTKSSGDACFIPGDSKPGTCIVDSDCSGGISYYRSQGKQVQICAFGRQTLICCPSGLSNRAGDEKISLRQCQNHPDLRASPKPGPRENGKVFAHLAAVGFQKGSRHEFKCWGALVSDSFVVTSATCFTINPSQPRVVRLGDHNVGLSATETLANVLRVVSHPMYRPRFYYYDVALLQIQPVTFSAHVAPACIWPHENEVPFMGLVPAPVALDGIEYFVQDFLGQEQIYNRKSVNNSNIDRLMISMPNDLCRLFYPEIEDSQLCLQTEPTELLTRRADSCFKVPGSLFQKVEYTEGKAFVYVVGLFSYVTDCEADNPAVFSRLSSFVDWMEIKFNGS